MEEFSQIYIGHDVWIGSRVFIRDGVAVGDGAIVGAGAVVVKDVPSYSIVGGVPAKVIRMRFDAETVARLDKIAWWNWPAERLRQAQPLIASSDTQSFLEWAEAQPNVAV
ncbi:MAG: CatB-related O-acetyltransferase [Planctomycetales bacterium]|nr:CatB-related O-acetyltransferase [Planctomycetales bacterium]